MGASFFADFANDADFLDVIQCAVLAGQKHAADFPRAARKGFSITISDDSKQPIYKITFKGDTHTVRRLVAAH